MCTLYKLNFKGINLISVVKKKCLVCKQYTVTRTSFLLPSNGNNCNKLFYI